MGLFWNRKALLAKLETTYGTDSAPVAGTNAILATDVSLSPMEGQDISRNLERVFHGAQETILVDLHSKLSFKVELQASGTAGTAPAWAPLMRACAFAQTILAGTSVTFSKISEAFESATIHLNIGGIRYVLLGARGTVRLEVGASAIPYLVFDFWGLFTQPTDQALPSPVLTAFQAPLVSTDVNTPTFTVNAVALTMRSFKLDAGNKVEPRFLIGPAGSKEMLITGQEEKVEMTVEQTPLATFNPFALAEARTQVALALLHGTSAGRRVAVNIPRLQIMRPPGLENRQNIVELPLTGTPLPNTGNDQLTIVCT